MKGDNKKNRNMYIIRFRVRLHYNEKHSFSYRITILYIIFTSWKHFEKGVANMSQIFSYIRHTYKHFFKCILSKQKQTSTEHICKFRIIKTNIE